MAANVLLIESQVVEAATAAALETALNAALTAIAALNVGPDGTTAIGANILSVSYGTTITTADVINLTCVIIYSYYGASA